MKMKRGDVKNIAIIAHADHGRTTLIDQLLRQSDVLRMNQEVQERIMDSNDLRRERGITILSKSTTVFYKDTKINITDTPGHADFDGETERVLKTVDDAVLVVDAYEGSVPQTEFVFQKALDLSLSVIVCINKIGGPEARPADVIDETLELMTDLDATNGQLNCPFVYTSTRSEFAKYKIEDPEMDISPLFETIINHIPAPRGDPDAGTQTPTSTTDCNEFASRIGIGRVDSGGLKVNQECVLVSRHEPDKFKRIKVGKLYEFGGLKKVEMQEADIGPTVAVPGTADIHIDDTICVPNSSKSTPFQKISEPTIAMYFMVNGSPLAGQEGKFITSRHLCDRLFRELNTDVNLRMEEADSVGCFKVSGHGELHLFILIENMRREDFESVVGETEVLYRYDGRNRRLEPMELAYVDVPEGYTNVVTQKLIDRKGALQGMSQTTSGCSRLGFSIPSRGLIGYRDDFLTDIKGDDIPNTIFDGYTEYKDDLLYRQTGSLITFEAGGAITYGLFNVQERGTLFIGSGVKVYSGTVMGRSLKAEDIEIDVCKTGKLTNARSSSADEALRLAPPRIASLEQALDFIDTDEPLGVTPESLHIRKKVLDPTLRKRAFFRNK